jgi:hypothetical protein
MGRDCSFAKRAAFRSENHESFEYDLKNGAPVAQQMWHVKDPLLLKAISANHKSNFAALSPSNSCHIAENYPCGYKQSNEQHK